MKRQEKLNDYNGFVEKFKPKKTTDDCMTPPEIYEVVKDYVCERWNIDPDKVVRPFRPGGDYESYDYSDGAVVIDNPPFSILAKICRFYMEREIPFFLFAPTLTLTSGKDAIKLNHIVCNAQIIYENGANVNTSFVTSFGYPNVLETCPELAERINEKMEELKRESTKQLPKYEYPDHVITVAAMNKLVRYRVDFSIKADEVSFVRALDGQKEKGKRNGIYGAGFLLSNQAAKRHTEAKRQAEEAKWRVEEAKRQAEARQRIVWQLSERELEIVKRLSENV